MPTRATVGACLILCCGLLQGRIQRGDWETVRRATIYFDPVGVVSQAIFEEYPCSEGKSCTNTHMPTLSAVPSGPAPVEPISTAAQR